MSLPDYSAREELIVKIGDAELLYKKGVKILRFKKSTWGSENNAANYNLIKPYFKGRVLNIGLGMGVSVDVALTQNVDELITYEIEQDIIDVYNNQHEVDKKVSIVKETCFDNKPDGDFDCILFELGEWVISDYDNIISYFDWIYDHLKGYCIIEYNKWNLAFINDILDKFDYTELSSGRRSEKKWIILTKKV